MCQPKPGPRCSADIEAAVSKTSRAQNEARQALKNGDISKEQFFEKRYARVAARANLLVLNKRKDGDQEANQFFEKRKNALEDVQRFEMLSQGQGLSSIPEHDALMKEYRKKYDEHLTAGEVFYASNEDNVPSDIAFEAFSRFNDTAEEKAALEQKIKDIVFRSNLVHQKLQHRVNPQNECYPDMKAEHYQKIAGNVSQTRSLDLVDQHGKPHATA